MSDPLDVTIEGDLLEVVIEEERVVLELWAGMGGDATSIRGRPIAVTVPATGQALAWNGSAWEPTSIGSAGEIQAVAADLAAHVANVSNPHGVTAAQVGAYTIAATDAAIAAHATRTDNPHAVTKAQVGLGSVENTALSTWAGSTALTTLGTITTGTWNATAVAWAKVDKTGSSLADLETRSASDLSSGNLPYAQLPTGTGTWTTGGDVSLSGGALILPATATAFLIGHTAFLNTANPNVNNGSSAAPTFQIHGTGTSNSAFAFERWVANATGPSFILAKSRGATIGTLGAVAAGDALGNIAFAGDDGTDLQTLAVRIRAAVDTGTTVSTNRIAGRLNIEVASGLSDDSITARTWSFLSTGELQTEGGITTSGAQTIQTSTGTLTLATAAGNGDVLISPHGTGRLRFGTFTGSADVAVTGSLEVKDAAGNTRKLATIA